MYRGKWTSKLITFSCTLIFGLIPGVESLAQSNFGSIRGEVTDVNGAAIANATVRITDVGTRAEIVVRTNEAGTYSATGLRPVTYHLSVEALGFKKAVRYDIKLDTSQNLGVNFSLTAGEVTETITVSSLAPLLQTETGTVAQTINQRVINDLPLNGRNTLELALTLPGATGSAGSEISEVFNQDIVPGRELSINGGRAGSTQFLADGANVTSIALARTSISFSPDTIQEFTVLQANYSAQYAQAGGAVIQQTTRSGTNEFHGTAYWFHRQRALSANPFNATRLPIFNNDARTPLRRQQLGFVIGGPVWLPGKVFGPAGIYDGRNRTFFFFSYEPSRQLASDLNFQFVRVPTEAELNGDFSQTRVFLPNGTTLPIAPLYRQVERLSNGTLAYLANPTFNPGQPVSATNPRFRFNNFPLFDNNGRRLTVNGVSYVNPVAQRIARELYPRPNIPFIQENGNPNNGANYVYNRLSNFRDDRYTLKIDQQIGSNSRLSGRYTEQPFFGDRVFRDPIGYGDISDTTDARQILLTWTSNIRSNLVNELRVSYNFGRFTRDFPTALQNRDLTNEYLNIGGPGAGRVNNIGFGGPRFFPGAAPRGENNAGAGRGWDALGFRAPQDVGKNTEHTYIITNDLTWVLGNQTLKMGVQGRLLMLNQSALGFGNQAGGRFNFSQIVTADRYCSATPFGGNINGCTGTAFGGDSFASFLLGIPDGLQIQTENLSNPYYYRWRDLGAYIQDDWKVRPNLTLNIGLRYSYQSPRWEKANLQGNMNISRLEANPFRNNLPSPVFEFAGRNGRSRYMYDPKYLDFEPRFSFAWTPGYSWNKRQRMVIRGGVGVTHTPLFGNDREPLPNIGAQTFSGYRTYSVVTGPNDNSAPTNQIITCGLAICNDPRIPMQFGFNNPVITPDPSLFNVPANGLIRPGDAAGATINQTLRQDVRYNAVGFLGDPNFVTPNVYNFSLQVQYELWMGNVVRVGYQGSRSTHLIGPSTDINRPDPFTGVQPIPGFNSRFGQGGIFIINPTNSGAIYHAGMVEYERRFSKGMEVRFNYTWSKNIDDSSGGITFPLPNNSFNNASVDVNISRNQTAYDSRAERALSSFHTPHIFNLSMLYDLPFGPGKRFMKSGVLGRVMGDWQISTLGRSRAGYPTSIALGRSNSLNLGVPGGTQRPDLIPGVPLKNPLWTPQTANVQPYVNPAAFAWPEPGRGGTAPRNLSLALPWVNTMDMSLFKRIRPFKSETRFFELRAEFFNIFNHRIFADNGVNRNLLASGDQNVLLSTNPDGSLSPIANVKNRFANLSAPGVWNALIKRSQGTGIDTVTADLAGPGPNGKGCPANAAELARTNLNPLSPACIVRDLSLSTNFFRLNQNSVRSRIVQLALKFYF